MLPEAPSIGCSYADARAYEAALLRYAETHGHTPQTLTSLSASALGRCAYRPATAWLHEALLRWPEPDQPLLGVNARLKIIQLALNGPIHDVANHWLDDLAHTSVIDATNAACIAEFSRGTGLSPALREILARCMSHLDQDAARTRMVETLLNDYVESEQLTRAVRLISIGIGCYGWLQPNRYMLRAVDETDLSMPFNMSVIPEFGVMAMLEDGFAGIDDASEYEIAPVVRGIPMARHRRYAALFNHECDDDHLRHGMAELRAIYAARARRFLEQACQGPRLYLCFLFGGTDIARLERAVARLARDDRYRLLILSCQIEEAPSQPANLLPSTRVAWVPFPAAGYNWVARAEMPEGYRYDLAVRRIVRDSMREAAEL